MSASKSNFVGDNDSGNSTAIEKLAQEIQNSKETQSFQKITKDIHGQQELEKESKNYKRNLNYFNG